MGRLSCERGQASAEYVGVVLVVAAILAAVGASGVGERLTSGLESALCEVARVGACASGEGPGAAGDPRARAGEPSGTRSTDPERSDGAAAAVPPRPGFGPSSSGPPPGVPGAPDPPPPPPGDADGSGEFDSSDPGFAGDVENELVEEAAYRGADIFEAIGREDAARHMRHFLGESGDPLEVDPARDPARHRHLSHARAEPAR